jgi:hypothetical protein
MNSPLALAQEDDLRPRMDAGSEEQAYATEHNADTACKFICNSLEGAPLRHSRYCTSHAACHHNFSANTRPLAN